MLMSYPTCNECHMNHINHIIYLISWTIILHAYNFQLNIHNNVNTFRTHILTFHQTTTNKHDISQQATTHLILREKCGIYSAHNNSQTALLNRAQRLAKQSLIQAHPKSIFNYKFDPVIEVFRQSNLLTKCSHMS